MAGGGRHRQARDRPRLASAGFRLFWTWKSRHRRGSTGAFLRTSAPLIRTMSDMNPLWGAPTNPRRAPEAWHRRQSSDGREVHDASPPPAVPDLADVPRQSRRPDRGRRFLRRADRHVSTPLRAGHSGASSVAASCTSAVTAHPTAAWTAQQLREAFPGDAVPRYLIHDRDHAFAAVGATATGMGIHELRTAPRSPWQNAYAERVIGSIRRECLDHVIVVNETGLVSPLDPVPDVLPPVANASLAGQGFATAPSDRAINARPGRGQSTGRRPTPSVRPPSGMIASSPTRQSVGVGVGRRSSPHSRSAHSGQGSARAQRHDEQQRGLPSRPNPYVPSGPTSIRKRGWSSW